MITQTQRNTWSKLEDQALTNIITNNYNIKWPQVAQMLYQKVQISKRTGKQCRQRWRNHLDPQLSKNNWSKQDQKILLKLQSKFGNKWAIISKSLPGRTDTFIKNQYYAIFRKVVRKLNKYIYEHEQNQFRIFSNNFVSKILLLSDLNPLKSKIPIQLLDLSYQIKNLMIKIYQSDNSENQDKHNNKQNSKQNSNEEFQSMRYLHYLLNKFKKENTFKKCRRKVSKYSVSKQLMEDTLIQKNTKVPNMNKETQNTDNVLQQIDKQDSMEELQVEIDDDFPHQLFQKFQRHQECFSPVLLKSFSNLLQKSYDIMQDSRYYPGQFL